MKYCEIMADNLITACYGCAKIRVCYASVGGASIASNENKLSDCGAVRSPWLGGVEFIYATPILSCLPIRVKGFEALLKLSTG